MISKKKVFAEIRRLFLAEIANFNVFSVQEHQLLPPIKIPWGGQEKNRGGKNENPGGIAPPLATRLVPSVEDWSGFALNKRDKKVFARAKFAKGKKHTDSTVEKLLGQLVTHFTGRSYKQNPTHAPVVRE